ncbi:JAB domain-containing protein [Nostoc ellipsosporum NOK]|nr:JAB domain-containing protein [Nostoc ellipsosporum NOK]
MKQTKSSLFNVAMIDISYKNRSKACERPRITEPEAAHKIFMAAWDLNKIDLVEHFYSMFLDQSGRCLGISHVASGGISACIVDPRIILSTAILSKSSGIILAHNHPSGHLKPSQNDLKLTERLTSVAKMLDINILDHLILSSDGFVSFAREGLMPS